MQDIQVKHIALIEINDIEIIEEGRILLSKALTAIYNAKYMSKHLLWVAKRADPNSAAVIRYFHSHFYNKLQNPRLREKKKFMLQSLAQWSNC